MPSAAPDNSIREGERILAICNACRYCEGYCPVFPAMERRVSFSAADLNYLANLCHNCSECYYACQYAPPHEFGVNVPKTLAAIRVQSYRQYAWRSVPAWLIVAILAAFVFLLAKPGPSAGFYGVVSHRTMVAIFVPIAVFVLVAIFVGWLRLWRESARPASDFLNLRALKQASADSLFLRYLHGVRRGFHHLTFYGFWLCFAATSVAAIYHYVFGWIAPYGYFSLPVILGTLGGIGLLIGPAGLFWQHRSQKETRDPSQTRLDVPFIFLLFFTSFTGLLLLALRETHWMPALLIVHLAFVLAFFLMLPYGKFVHGIYRMAALIRYSLERSPEN